MSHDKRIEDWKDSALDVVWPESPIPPRIKLLRVISTGKDLQGKDQNRVFFNWLLGESTDNLPLISPYGIAADGVGRVWIADQGGRGVQVFDLARQRTEFIGQAGSVPLEAPVGIAVDKQKNVIYVSDSGRREVYLFSTEGDYRGKLEAPPGGFGRPAGLAIDSSGTLYVVDVTRGVIDLFDRSKNYLRSVGSASARNGLFNHPSNVAVDSVGRVYVVDSLRFRVEVQAADGKLIGLIGQLGDAAGTFSRPRGVAIDSDGHIYVVDAAFDNIQIFDLTGRLLLVVGGPGSAPGELCLPAGLHIDSADRIYVTEACNHRFQVMQYLGVLEE